MGGSTDGKAVTGLPPRPPASGPVVGPGPPSDPKSSDEDAKLESSGDEAQEEVHASTWDFAARRMFRPLSLPTIPVGVQHLAEAAGAGVHNLGQGVATLWRPSLDAARATRLDQRSKSIVEHRADALKEHRLAPEGKPVGTPLREMLVNVWVLLVMVGIVTIIIVASDRIHVTEPLEGVHATGGFQPYVAPLDASSVDFLFVSLVIGPYLQPQVYNATDQSSSRRRLASWVGTAVAAHDSTHGGGPIEDAELAAGVRQLLAKPKLVLPQRHRRLLASGGGVEEPRRRLLAGGGLEEPANAAPVSDGTVLPRLNVTLLQWNASAPANSSLADVRPGMFVRVSDTQSCTTKNGAAAKCQLEFRSGDLNEAYVEGRPLYMGFYSTQVTQVVFWVEVSELGGLGPAKNWLALTIFVLVLLAIATERVHRVWCAMVGSCFMLSLLLWMNLTPSLQIVVSWLDESTLALLFGMMIIVGRLKDTGSFEVLSAWTVKACRGRMGLLTTMLLCATGFTSAWLDNVTTMLLMAPVSISVMMQASRDPLPLLLAQALISNIGGAATMVGDPPALIIGNALSDYIGFMDFIANMAPGVLMAAAACIPLLLWLYRKDLTGPIANYEDVLEEARKFHITDWRLMAKCTYVTLMVVIGFLLHPVHHVDPAWFALLGAIVLCISDDPMEIEKVVKSVEWDLLLFFAAMFTMVAAAEELGMISMIGGWLESWIRAAPESSRLIVAIQILLWVSALISGILDNIPYTITMVPVIEYLASAGLGLELSTLAWALNFGACFGGNATLVGASANIVTATLAERAGLKLTFVYWLKGGVIITLVSVAIADVWLILRFCL